MENEPNKKSGLGSQEKDRERERQRNLERQGQNVPGQQGRNPNQPGQQNRNVQGQRGINQPQKAPPFGGDVEEEE